MINELKGMGGSMKEIGGPEGPQDNRNPLNHGLQVGSVCPAQLAKSSMHLPGTLEPSLSRKEIGKHDLIMKPEGSQDHTPRLVLERHLGTLN